MKINAVIAGYASPLTGVGNFSRITPLVTPAPGSAISQAADAFDQGQWWKNQAGQKVASPEGVRRCGCGQCSACAAQVYKKQEKSIPPGAMPAGGAPVADANAAAGGSVEGKASPGAPGVPAEDEENRLNPAAAGPKAPDGHALSQAEQLQLAQLKKIDAEVKAHELAHLAAAGAYAKGGIAFQYQRGPDGQSYAVGGEVQIDTSPASSPEATISKMQTVRAAALAPANPSPQDRKVAALASRAITDASQELRMIRLEQARGEGGGKVSGAPGPGGKVSAAGDLAGQETAPEKKLVLAAGNHAGQGSTAHPADFSRGLAGGALSSSFRITV